MTLASQDTTHLILEGEGVEWEGGLPLIMEPPIWGAFEVFCSWHFSWITNSNGVLITFVIHSKSCSRQQKLARPASESLEAIQAKAEKLVAASP